MKVTFAPALRKAGLRGSAGRFDLPSDSYWAQLGFQESAYSDGQRVRFTINLCAVRHDEWARQIATQPYLGRQPTPTVSYVFADQSRIGQLTPEGEDKWWRILRGVDVRLVRDDAVHDLLTYAVPWLRERVA